jgi:hypothetical protein
VRLTERLIGLAPLVSTRLNTGGGGG